LLLSHLKGGVKTFSNITDVCFSSFKRTMKNGEIVNLEIRRGKKEKKTEPFTGEFHRNNTDGKYQNVFSILKNLFSQYCLLG
jgi:hypothetical protein